MEAKELEQEMRNAERLPELKARVRTACCRYCGGRLELRRILYGRTSVGRIEVFCHDCDRIEYGADRNVYAAARYFVDEFDFDMFPENDESVKRVQMNVAKVCDILSWGCKSLGLLGFDGFTVPVDASRVLAGEDAVYRDADLDRDDADDVEIIVMDEDAIFNRRTGAGSCL